MKTGTDLTAHERLVERQNPSLVAYFYGELLLIGSIKYISNE